MGSSKEVMNGYGINLSEAKFKNLREFIETYDKKFYEEMVEDFRDSDVEMSDLNIEGYLDNYENGCGYYGISAYLADVINEHEGLDLRAYDEVYPGYIYVAANYPWAFDENMRKLTKENLHEIFVRYLSEIIEEPIKCEDLEIWVSRL